MTAPAPEAPRTVVRVLPADTAPLPRPERGLSEAALGQTMIVLGLVAVWVLSYLFVFSDFQQGHAQHRLYAQLRTELALGEAPAGAPIAVGAPVALVSVPDAGIDDLVVVEGTTAAVLQQGPGHQQGSVLPGQAGVSVLMGRALSFGAPFKHVPQLRVGDPIDVTTVQGTFHYEVSGVRRKGDPVPPALTDGASRITLVTAVGEGRLAALGPSKSVYVDATLDGDAQPAGAVAAIDPQGAPFAHDAGFTTLAVLALALEVLVAAVLLVVWARHRWTPLAAWVAGVPVILAALWLVSSAASRLLPNLV
ncbi:class E sortase [Nocardioides conyzicola]|uniref:Sortase n=1 Tax=Nocardioides conyzicola TaxID=1651781 RepID=A0ABP8XMY8_9ACTN